MNKIEITKTVVSFVVGAGVTKIVNDVIANNINTPEKVTEKVAVLTGAIVIGMAAKDASKAYTNTKIDSYAKSWNTLKLKMDETKKNK